MNVMHEDLIQKIVQYAYQNNVTPKQLMQDLTDAVENNAIEKRDYIAIINQYLSKNSKEEEKLLLVAALSHINLKIYFCDAQEMETLTKNLCRRIRATHKSVIGILETLKKFFKDPRISTETSLYCLLEILIRTNRSPYPINKPVEELCKRTIQILANEQREKLFLLHINAINAKCEVHCCLLAELLKHVTHMSLFQHLPILLVYIMQGFCSNITSVQRSYIYKTLVERLSFTEWEELVFTPFLEHFNQLHSNECFMESVKSYFIPMTALKYRENFYVACRQSISNLTFCAAALLYLTKHGLCNYYCNDVAAFCEREPVASIGFELLCISKNFSQILNFLYEYGWVKDEQKNVKSLKRVVSGLEGENFRESLFYFSLTVINSRSRTLVDLGSEILKMVCDKRWFYVVLNVYMKNSAISPGFIYDLTKINKYDLIFIMKKYESYRSSKNICHLTKASCIFHMYIKTESCDLNFFVQNVEEALKNVGAYCFQNVSILFYIKTLKLLCEDGIVNESAEKIFKILNETVIVLLTNKIQHLNTVEKRKLYESLLSDILGCMHAILLHHKKSTFQTTLLNSCHLTIQLSNFKQPVTTASLILQKSCVICPDETLSTLINNCFDGINTNDTNMSTIRCSAEYRLVIENICVANPQKTQAIFLRLLEALKNRNASEYCVEAVLHTVDALLANKSLQKFTRCYTEEVIDIILKSDWMRCFRTRNATVQVWRTLLKTFKSAPLENVFLQYRRLPRIFHETLIENTNEKSLLVLSTFIECGDSGNMLKPNLGNVLNAFEALFVHLILEETGYCGKFAAAAYAAQCSPDTIIFVLHDVVAFSILRQNACGVLANIAFLVRTLVKKYITYFKSIEPLCRILYVYLHSFQNSLLPPCLVKNNTHTWLFKNDHLYNELSVGAHICLLSSMITKQNLQELTNLIVQALAVQTKSQYLLQAYVQTIFFLYETTTGIVGNFILFKQIDTTINYSLHHLLIFSLLFSHGTDFPLDVQNMLLKKLFCYCRTILHTEDPENLSLFASTLPYIFKCAQSGRRRLTVFKLATIFMVCGDTDNEFCKFIATSHDSKLTNLMCSVKRFLKYENLIHHLRCADLVFEFLVEASVYISQLKLESETSCFYSVDTESYSLVLPVVQQMLFKCFKDLYFNKSRQ